MSAIEARRGPQIAARASIALILIVAMGLFGLGVYRAASLFKSSATAVQRPTGTTFPALPGTMYVVQDGAIYRFANGSFRQVTSESGWIQPSLSPDGSRLVVARRSLNRSDLFVLSPLGRVLLQLTHNQSPSVETNHWAFYPRYSPDGSAVYFSYDPKDPYNTYRVDLAIFATGAHDASAPAVQWSQPNEYTGGDVDPIPLRNGALLYTKFSIDQQSVVHSQIWYAPHAGSPGIGLTKPADDCGQPALSNDQSMVAMVCRHGGLQSADLEVASFDPSVPALGSFSVLVGGGLAASPSFSPDGKLIAFLAPGADGGPFQLWTVDPNPATTHSARQITTHLDLDSGSAPAWAA